METEYRDFSSPEEIYNWVKASYSSEQLYEFDCVNNRDTVVGDYKGGFYKHMNACINLIGIEKYADYGAKDLQAALLKCSLPENIVVTRFVPGKEWLMLLKQTRRNKVHEYNCFLSTTLLKNNYSMDEIKHYRILIKIYATKGTPGMFILEVNPEAPEFEILFPCKTKIKRVGLFSFMI